MLKQLHNLMRRPVRTNSGEKSGFWFALVIALALHALILLIPMVGQTPGTNVVPAQVELQLTTHQPEPSKDPVIEPEPLPEPLPEPKPEPKPESPVPRNVAETPQIPKTPTFTPAPPIRELEPDIERMTQEQRSRLANAILMRQFLSEESAVDKIFGKPLQPQTREPRKEFHYPARQNMVTMLDQPMPDLPFAYTPDLIYFAYDPGVKGDLQRFWDVITPEFGWRTDNGTEFKCKLILIIAACGWK